MKWGQVRLTRRVNCTCPHFLADVAIRVRFGECPARRGRSMKHFRIALLVIGLTAAGSAHAGDIEHFNPGVLNIRDLLVPADPGFYTLLYQYYYQSERLNDANGDKVRSLDINPGPGPGLNVAIDVDVDLYALMPMVAWVSEWKILGA